MPTVYLPDAATITDELHGNLRGELPMLAIEAPFDVLNDVSEWLSDNQFRVVEVYRFGSVFRVVAVKKSIDTTSGLM
jgi:hypothetical protein